MPEKGPERAFRFDLPAGRMPFLIERLRGTAPRIEEKVRNVSPDLLRRRLGPTWSPQENIGHLIGESMAARGAGEGGIVWTYARPPVIGLDYEMDVRGAAREIVI